MPTTGSRRIGWFATTILAAVVIGACGGGSTGGATTAPVAPASAAQGALPQPELTKVKIGISAPSEPVQFAETLAERLGFYKKYGITNVEIIGFEGDGKAVQAMIAGQIDFALVGVSSAINSVITDTPFKVVSANGLVLTDGLWCTANIKTPADVKGKTVAISTFGGTSHGAALLGLQAIGLTSKDVVVTQVGGESSRIAALKGGSVGCGVVDMSEEKPLRAAGLNLLADLAKAKVQWGRSGLAVRTDFIAKNPNTVLVVVAAALEAQNSMWTDPKTAAAKFAEFAQAKPDEATAAINDFLPIGDRSMRFDAEAFKAPRDVLAAVNPAVANVDVNKAFDLTFLNKLKDNGFYTKNNIPLN
ncbi:MAG TPA: ABC transporter substrate-binding protein [Candidatus Limnocylindria bacterium]|nr:ABC transporter substrate-binding protein [Candidatus Limnocylindria bacterium]